MFPQSQRSIRPVFIEKAATPDIAGKRAYGPKSGRCKWQHARRTYQSHAEQRVTHHLRSLANIAAAAARARRTTVGAHPVRVQSHVARAAPAWLQCECYEAQPRRRHRERADDAWARSIRWSPATKQHGSRIRDSEPVIALPSPPGLVDPRLRTRAFACGSSRSPAPGAGGCVRATDCTCRRSP
jgi:hypothetical protein